MNELLEEESNNHPEHSAWYPKRSQSRRAVKDVSVSSSIRKEANEKMPRNTKPSYASSDEEILERLIELQD